LAFLPKAGVSLTPQFLLILGPLLRNFSEIEKGFLPQLNLILDASGNLYGTTADGGLLGGGTVFALTP
jgi:uncharacterized repeat protein (TIGR03803 family)